MKKFYITTAIPYANDRPHIGHALDFLYADILARYHRKQVNTLVSFSIGTDEHGSKIAEKAAIDHLSPQAFVDKMAPLWQDFAKKLNVSNDRFVRTTEKGHEQRAALIWKALEKDIYKGKYVGWYCVGCEEYKTETHVADTNGTCPLHNRPYDKLEEENYFFKLSSYTEKLINIIETQSLRVVPTSKRHEIMNVLKDGLEDLSISRPKEKITWGISVPGDESQVMYVWFEALMNYITVIGYPEHEDFKKLWPADVQVVGKDILRFHAAIWPAMLLGLGLPTQKNLLVHGFVTSGGKKMSKTLGNVIDPITIIDTYGVDAFRYFFTRHIPSTDDGDFTPERFEASYNGELANELGNAVQRVASMIKQYQDGVIGDIPEASHDQGQYHQAFIDYTFDKAMEFIWTQVRGLNQYIDTEKPWILAKEPDGGDHLREVLAYCVSNILEIADLLEPFMPDTSAKINILFKDGLVHPTTGSLFPRHEAK